MFTPGTTLQDLLTSTSITHQAFADFIGTSRGTITRIANVTPKRATAATIAACLLHELDLTVRLAESQAIARDTRPDMVPYNRATMDSLVDKYYTLMLLISRATISTGPAFESWLNRLEKRMTQATDMFTIIERAMRTRDLCSDIDRIVDAVKE